MTSARGLFADLSDDDLLMELRRSVAADRATTARVVEVLAEVDARRLYLAEGCSSLFMYCTRVLHLSEHAAYNRIEAARLARRMPQVIESLRTGDVTLTTVCLLGPHLTADNCRELLAAARHKSKRDVEQIVAALDPKPDVRGSVRRLPVRTAAHRQANDVVSGAAAATTTSRAAAPTPTDSCLIASELSMDARKGSGPAAVQAPSLGPPEPLPGAVISPLAPERFRIQFTASREVHDKLRRAQDLLRHAIPDGNVAAVFDRALTLLVEELERRKLAAVARPRAPRSLTSDSRHIPAAVKRIVWARDGGQCTFIGTQGRCTERGFLEVHHLVPFAAGGETSAGNLALRCRAHNAYEAEQFFGPLFAREGPRPCYAGLPRSVRNESGLPPIERERHVTRGAMEEPAIAGGPSLDQPLIHDDVSAILCDCGVDKAAIGRPADLTGNQGRPSLEVGELTHRSAARPQRPDVRGLAVDERQRQPLAVG